MRIISWNLLRLEGAAVQDVAGLLERERPDLLLMQEVTQHMDTLPALVSGHYHRLPWPGRIHGLAAWSRHHFATPQVLPLPASPLPGRLPRRRAQLVKLGEITFANVHLSHGQLLNRRQLLRIASALRGTPAAIIGDYNAVGPSLIPGFSDVGPREATHFGGDVVPFRLDRCLAHCLTCTFAGTLEFGPSDHKPIVLDLQVAEARVRHRAMQRMRRRLAGIRAAFR
ncbi:Endonuclease/Exonuclease/phosphatase family protein [Enhydrobacter aerosaccus]|uniref:Endonuclease/Exonuclease/phosphatase family protein n=1 Tax=Enhydrobacter aerosaccus TaxID=225324 RepID=A0A1T4TEQ6_9HYPH|nr:endonuclease/exonuclease/phosphatase family protein [Enhydrobacter aerosaccus]SKA38801.1 Endonuclease/Exonuclease/phosphatase family protein [Enhydrobacter aerosaccus]